MAHLIIGHTTHRSTRIWVHDENSSNCRITLSAVPSGPPLPPDPPSLKVPLSRATDRTATAAFDGLHPGTEYHVQAEFSRPGVVATGRFRSMAAPETTQGAMPFSFVLVSCHLPAMTVNNLLAYLLAMGGAAAVRSSLDLPLARWNGSRWGAWLLRWLGKGALFALATVVTRGNRARQPPPPYLRSPFLKLHAVFDAHIIELDEAKLDVCPAAGDRIHTGSGSGYVASLEKTTRAQIRREQERQHQRRRGRRIPGGTRLPALQDADQEREYGVCTLVVTHVEGRFSPGQTLAIEGREPLPLRVRRACRARPWYANPAFFIHAGDQIYFDFPEPDASPARRTYRRAYQEAWLDDASARHVLAHWPHYMTLDDHEIADQFANDFEPANTDGPLERYAQEALAAYDEYVEPRNPASPGTRPEAGRKAYWYQFDHGRAHFFVLDTRTERYVRDGIVIGQPQMDALLEWLGRYPRDLKFIVTSVPFVAEFDTKAAEEQQDWYRRHGGNPPNDKWSAPEFRVQRSTIIEHIHRHGIEHVVFLTGDMHCCYHAVMRIGNGAKHLRLAVHELGSGPLNQLQLPDLGDFRTQRTGRTAGAAPRTTTAAGTGSATALDAREQSVEYEVTLEQFHSQVSAVLHLTVNYAREDPLNAAGPVHPQLTWNIVRTVTDVGVAGWAPDEAERDRSGLAAAAATASVAALRPGETTPRARIHFGTSPSARHGQWSF